MKKLFITIITTSILIGVIGLSINLLWGNETVSYLTSFTENNIVYYKYDFYSYLKNIKISTLDTSILQLKLHTRTWTNDIVNNLAYMLDTLIVPINILLYPIRVSAYMGRTLLSIVGIDIQTENGLSWLIDTMNVLINLQIPYV